MLPLVEDLARIELQTPILAGRVGLTTGGQGHHTFDNPACHPCYPDIDTDRCGG